MGNRRRARPSCRRADAGAPVTLSGLDSEEVVGYRLVNGQWLAVYEKWFSDSQMTVNVQF